MRMLIGSMLALTIALSGSVATAHTVRIVGYLENATILPIGLAMKAKMDTGADVTLMHAIDIERYQEDGENWVRFTLEGEGRNVIVRRPLVRVTRLRFAGNQSRRTPGRTAWALRCGLLQACGGYLVRSFQDELPIVDWQALHAFRGAGGRSRLGERRSPDLRLSAAVFDRGQPMKACVVSCITQLEQHIWTKQERISKSLLFSMAAFWRSKRVVLNS